MKDRPLPERYLKALELLEAGDLSYQQIADATKIPRQAFYDLIEGRLHNYGKIGEKFTELLNAIQKRRDKEIRDLIKKNKKNTQYIIDKYLVEIKNRKDNSKSMPTVVAVANALSKSTPNVEIGSFSYTKGLSAEDLIHEFRRLKGLATDGRGVSEVAGSGTGEISLAEGSRDSVKEEPEDTIL